MRIRTRVERLERRLGVTTGRCPECNAPLGGADVPESKQHHCQMLVYSPDSGEPEIPLCPRCRQPRGDVLVIEEIVICSSNESAAVKLEQSRTS